MKHLKAILVGLFVITAFADIITTIMFMTIDPTVALRESNPLVVMGINIWFLFVVKILLVAYLANAMMKRKFVSERFYFFMLTFLMLITFTQGMASYGNLVLYNNYEYYNKLPVPSDEQLTDYYVSTQKEFVLLPFILAFLPYIFFEMTAPYQEFKKRRLMKK